MQESVGVTAARACVWLLDTYIKRGMNARPMICLYDAVCTLCDADLVEEVKQLHNEKMHLENTWEYHGRTLKYPIDTDLVLRWSTDPDDEEKQLIKQLTE